MAKKKNKNKKKTVEGDGPFLPPFKRAKRVRMKLRKKMSSSARTISPNKKEDVAPKRKTAVKIVGSEGITTEKD